ncbi:MAG TPA: hypothetical protein VJY33_17170 [Isosphaeraceae bacterium]|nr:hypothetical protein [Isosphaeraceae bacterium]
MPGPLAPYKAAVLLPFAVAAGSVAKVGIDEVRGHDKSRNVKLESHFWVIPLVRTADNN